MLTLPLDITAEIKAEGWTDAEPDVNWPGGFENVYVSDVEVVGFELTKQEKAFLVWLANKQEFEAYEDGDHEIDEEIEVEISFETNNGQFFAVGPDGLVNVTRLVAASDSDDLIELLKRATA